MLTYIIRRLLLMIPTLIGVTMVVFFIMAYAPGGFQTALDKGSQGCCPQFLRRQQLAPGRRELRARQPNVATDHDPAWFEERRVGACDVER